MPILEVRNVSKHFGGLAAVDNLTFDIHEGELLGLIGPNGAGKSTVFNLISGVLPVTRGEIIYEGQTITDHDPHELAKRGLVRTFQAETLFPDMTLMECMSVGFHLRAPGNFWSTLFNLPGYGRRFQNLKREWMEILRYLGLDGLLEYPTKKLPHGHKRALAIALAIAASPRLLLLDEPVTGMRPDEVMPMMEKIVGLRERHTTVCIVEHNMRAVMGFCQRIVVVNFGHKIAEGTPEEIKDNLAVQEAYLGSQAGVPLLFD